MSPGQLIAKRFEIRDLKNDLLGRGGMGAVYKALDRQSSQTVAVKILTPGMVNDQEALVERFIREGEALRQLDHPNIVEMVAAVEENGQHFLVMEYVAGGSLKDLIQEDKALPIKRAVEIGMDLADALTRAHRLGIIHRDLKPANVLLAEDGTPRLTDFGIARFEARITQLTEAGALLGTVEYLSPEMCEGQPIDERADIWSFGVLLFEMLTGSRPFSSGQNAATLMAIIRQPTPDLSRLRPDTPDDLADLIYRMLEKDPRQRIPSVRLVGAELEAVLRHWESGPADHPETRVADSAKLEAALREEAMLPVPSRFQPTMPGLATPTRHNLPGETAAFVGRETELTKLQALIEDPHTRLVTIMGPGGMGKTRLALELARRQIDNFEHGVYFVSLAPLQSVETLVPTVAQACNFAFYAGGEPRQELLDYLHHKQMLLIMDNFEHILEGAGLVTDILQSAPGLQVIATSRERLGLQGEQLLPIRGLSFPSWESVPASATSVLQARLKQAPKFPAVRLFVQSAQRVRSDFKLETQHLEPLSRICQLVQGMPLGLVLAAAWIEVLKLSEIAVELSRSLDLLETNLQDVPQRQRSMRVVFDYSWTRLNEREQAVFSQLTVFRGGFSRGAAQQVSNASLNELMSLANKSLVYRQPDGRYQIHEVLRRLAAEKLATTLLGDDIVRDRHAAYYCALLQRREKSLEGSGVEVTLREIDLEIENARAAWDWSVESGQAAQIGQAAESLGRYYWLRTRAQEGEAAFRSAAKQLEAVITRISRPAAPELQVLARVLIWQSTFSRYLGQADAAEQLIRQSQALLSRPELSGQDLRREQALVLLSVGRMAYYAGRLEDARQVCGQALSLNRQLGDSWGEAAVLGQLGWIAINSGAYAEAHQLFQASLRLYRQLGNQLMTASSLVRLGQAALYRGETGEAERLMREGLEMYQEGGSNEGTIEAQFRLAEVSILQGKFAGAEELLTGVIVRREEQGHRFGLAYANAIQCQARLHLGQYEAVRNQVDLSMNIFQGANSLWGLGFCHFLLACAALAEGDYDEARRQSQQSVAMNREIGQRDELSWALAVRSYANRGLGYPAFAAQDLEKAFQTGLDIQGIVPLLLAIPSAALLLSDEEKTRQAVELYALAERHPFVANSLWFKDVAGQAIHDIEAGLPADIAAAAAAQGRAADLWAVSAGLLDDLRG